MIKRNYIRKFYRIQPEKNLYAEMTIRNVNGKKVNTGRAIVRIVNISPGGLSFLSDLSFPATRRVILEFKIILGNKAVILQGFVVYCLKAVNNMMKYGICFCGIDESKKSELRELLRSISVRTRNYSVLLKLKLGKDRD